MMARSYHNFSCYAMCKYYTWLDDGNEYHYNKENVHQIPIISV